MAAGAQPEADRPYSCRSELRLPTRSMSVVCIEYVPGLRLSRHSHAPASVSVILRGGFGSPNWDKHDCVCPAGTGLVTPAHEPHSNDFFSEPTRMLVVEIADPVRPLPEPFEQLLLRPAMHRGLLLSELARRAAAEVAQPDPTSPLMCEGLGLELAAAMARLRETKDRRPPPWLLRVRDLLHDSLERTPSLEELAQVAGVERTRLLRAFRNHLRSSPGAYLRQARVARAAQLLRETDEPISGIAALTGFADQSHLTRLFKRLMGRTPAAFRALR